jgi:CRISPR/Cas system CSM-associated protein Csm3 (group 7 of RAMP superfamily)
MEIIRYNIILETKEPFRIGALESPITGVHNPVARIGGKVVAQGPSLKGALRAEIERHIIENYLDSPGMKPCIPSAERTLTQGERKLIEVGPFKRGGSCQYREERRRRERRPPGEEDYICPVCYLLGAQGIVGFVRVPYLFTDAMPEELYAIRIDRAAGTVAKGTSRDYQIMAPNIRFEGTMEVLIHDPMRNWRLGKPRPLPDEVTRGDIWLKEGGWSQERILDELIVQRMQSIKLLGGFKSLGCGKVSIHLEQVS